jgi:hypothetical protein
MPELELSNHTLAPELSHLILLILNLWGPITITITITGEISNSGRKLLLLNSGKF